MSTSPNITRTEIAYHNDEIETFISELDAW